MGVAFYALRRSQRIVDAHKGFLCETLCFSVTSVLKKKVDDDNDELSDIAFA